MKLVFHERDRVPGGLKLMLHPGDPPIPGMCPDSAIGCTNDPNFLTINLATELIVIEGTEDAPFLSCLINTPIDSQKVLSGGSCAIAQSDPDACKWCYIGPPPSSCDGSNSPNGLGMFQDMIQCADQSWIFVFSELSIFAEIRWFAAWHKPVVPEGDTSPLGGYRYLGASIFDPLIHVIFGSEFAVVTETLP